MICALLRGLSLVSHAKSARRTNPSANPITTRSICVRSCCFPPSSRFSGLLGQPAVHHPVSAQPGRCRVIRARLTDATQRRKTRRPGPVAFTKITTYVRHRRQTIAVDPRRSSVQCPGTSVPTGGGYALYTDGGTVPSLCDSRSRTGRSTRERVDSLGETTPQPAPRQSRSRPGSAARAEDRSSPSRGARPTRVLPSITSFNAFESTMNFNQITLIRETWPVVAGKADALTATFYARLFEIDGAAAKLFAHVDMAAQRKKLAQSLAVVVAALDDPDSLLPAISALGKRHTHYGVETPPLRQRRRSTAHGARNHARGRPTRKRSTTRGPRRTRSSRRS